MAKKKVVATLPTAPEVIFVCLYLDKDEQPPKFEVNEASDNAAAANRGLLLGEEVIARYKFDGFVKVSTQVTLEEVELDTLLDG